MNHDYAHCLDYTKDCPRECFRAQLQKDIEERRSEFVGNPLTYAHLGGTDECKLVRGKKMRLIDADKLKDTISDTWILDRIDEQPTIVPVKWIPVSERLPEVGRSVLLSVGKEMYTAEGFLKDNGTWAQFRWSANLKNVDAWAEMPKPWKGEENV